MFDRVLLKLSGEALSGDNKDGFDEVFVNRIVGEIIEVKKRKTQVALVVGGGNYWRGAQKGLEINRAKSDQIGMLATVMNAIYLAEIFNQKNIKALVMTPFVCGNFTKQYSQEDADMYLNQGYILIFAGGLGHPFFSTDTIAAVRAIELKCDSILYAKTIDGIYDSDPKTNPNAIKFNKITYKEIIEKDLRAIDISAMNLCNDMQIPTIAFSLAAEGSIILACENNEEIFKIGTKITFI